jgi:hypothetical protein
MLGPTHSHTHTHTHIHTHEILKKSHEYGEEVEEEEGFFEGGAKNRMSMEKRRKRKSVFCGSSVPVCFSYSFSTLRKCSRLIVITYIHAYGYVYMHVDIYIMYYMYIIYMLYTCIHVCVYIYTHTHTYTYTYTHIHIHTHTHTHTYTHIIKPWFFQ